MIKLQRKQKRGKIISSNLLSGINIRKMINDQIEVQHTNTSESSIIKMFKRPFLKVKGKESQKQNTEVSVLPSKSFKIRSFTKKLRDQSKNDNCTALIFQKIQNIRNFKSISNRIDQLGHTQREKESDSVVQQRHKLKQILLRQAQIKRKMNKIYAKELVQQKQINIQVNPQRISTQKYRSVSNKIHICLNPNYHEQSPKKILLIISLESLNLNRKTVKNSIFAEAALNKSVESKKHHIFKDGLDSFKLLMSSNIEKGGLEEVRIVFKTQNACELQLLKSQLSQCKFIDFSCIFHPLSRYSELWNLYQIEPLLQNISQVILLQNIHTLQTSFPILNNNIGFTAVITNHEYSRGYLSKQLQAINQIVIKINNLTDLQTMVEDVDEDEVVMPLQPSSVIHPFQVQEQHCKNYQFQNLVQLALNSSQVILPDLEHNRNPPKSKLQCKVQNLQINISQLNAKLAHNSQCQQLRSLQRGKKGERSNRRMLCQKDCNRYVSSVQQYSNHQDQQVNINQLSSCENMRDNLLQCFQIKQEKINYQKVKLNSRNEQQMDEVEQITNTSTYGLKAKTLHQLVSDLVKKNNHIHRQLSQYFNKINVIKHYNHFEVSTTRQSPSQPISSILQLQIYRFQ